MPRFGKSGSCALLLITAVTLTACEVTATGSGTVTITTDMPVTEFDGVSPYGGTPSNTGDILAFCAAGITCAPDLPGSILFWFKPDTGDIQAVFAPGSPVLDPAGNSVPLPVGGYRVQGIRFSDTNIWERRETVDFIIGGSDPDLSTSMQSTARASAAATCATGWTQSWAQWPNDGKGGYVCNRWIYTYYPDIPVATQKPLSSVQPWHQEFGRTSIDATCPDGYGASWSQWPNNNTGGFVCTRDSVD